jgi:hypothetical protein
MRLEYAIVEWLWDNNSIRVNTPDGEEKRSEGTYIEVVSTLTELGKDGWDVASCVANGNWIFWTLKRNITPGGRA